MSGRSPPRSPAPLIEEFTIVFAGNALGYVIYGMFIAVATTNLALLRKKKNKILFVFTLSQLVVTTVYNVVQMYSSPPLFLAQFQLAGGVGANLPSLWPNVLVNVAYVVNSWTSDAFLVYRCYIVLMGYKYAIAALPALLYLAVVGSSIAYLRTSVDPSATFSTTAVRMTALSYWSFSVALNVVASCIIAVRFWWLRRKLFHSSTGQWAFYQAYTAMTLESALLYTAFGIAALVSLLLNDSTVEAVFFTMLSPIQVLAAALIINRIARGISIESDFGSSGVVLSTAFYGEFQHQSYGQPTNEDFAAGPETAHGSSDGGVKLVGKINDETILYSYNSKQIVSYVYAYV